MQSNGTRQKLGIELLNGWYQLEERSRFERRSPEKSLRLEALTDIKAFESVVARTLTVSFIELQFDFDLQALFSKKQNMLPTTSILLLRSTCRGLEILE